MVGISCYGPEGVPFIKNNLIEETQGVGIFVSISNYAKVFYN